jgi:cell division protein FtsW
MIHKITSLKKDLRIFIGIVTGLIIVGVLFVYSASSVFALEYYHSTYYFVKQQCKGLLLGIIIISGIQLLPSLTLKKITPFLFIASLIATAATLVPFLSKQIHGSSRWISVYGFGFQPSELLKVFFIMYLAYFLEKKRDRKNSFVHGYLPLIIAVGITCFIILKQPDFGLAITLCLATLSLLFVANFNLKYLLFTLCTLIPISIWLIISRPYRMQRILTFLNPWQDPHGTGFQIIQSLIAIGSGNIVGIGIGNSKQKFFYLPMQHTDFIFSIIAEETGFVGSLCIIIFFMLFLYYGIKIANHMKTHFSFFTILGFILLITLESIMNMAVVSGLVPTKGIGLPFISYGNTALVCSLIMIGIIINLAQDNMRRIVIE